MRRIQAFALALVSTVALGFLDFDRGPAVKGNEMFAAGDFEAALNLYGEALVDEPESGRLNFNMGNAHVRLGNYEDALASYARVRDEDDGPSRAAKVAYNAGNAQFRLAEQIEAENPQQALEAYALAMAAYRRSIGIDPSDDDAKFNYEFARKRLEDLRKWLEEQEKQEQEQNPNEEQQPEPEDQDQPGEQQPQRQEAEEPPQQDPEEQADRSDDPGQREEPQAADQGDPAAEESDRGEEMSEREAAALVDMASDEELRPEEFSHQMRGAVVGDPLQDW